MSVLAGDTLTNGDPPLKGRSGSSRIDGIDTLPQAGGELLDQGIRGVAGCHQGGGRVQEDDVTDRAAPSLENLMNDAGVVVGAAATQR